MTNSETAGAGAAPDRPTKQPEALRLADALERPGYGWHSTPAQCAAELRRLHVENTTLQAGYAAARLEIESLQRRVQEVGAVARREHERADRAMRAAQPAEATRCAATLKAQNDQFEHALAELVDLVCPGLDSGNLLVDAKTAGDAAQALRASHGQAPAQAAPAAPPVPKGWSFDVKRSDGRVWLTIKTPYGASATLSAAEKTGTGDDTIVAQVLDHLADSLAAAAAVAGPSDWRELAAKVMDALADAQEQTNAAYPAHVSCYPGWEAQARWLRWHADMFRTGKPAGNGAGHPAVLAALAAAPTTQPAPHPVDEFQPCPSCFGKGVEGDADDYGRTIDVTCGECNGSGRAQATTQPAPQQEAQEPYSIDADPQGIRALVADAITGALAFGAQGTNAPPDGHWLAPFWAAARAESEAAPQPSPASQGDAARLEQRSQPSESGGMTVAGSGASELGKLMREQRALRGGVYPDGNPNAARTKGGE